MNTFDYISGVESRTQDSRPRIQKNLRPRTAFPRTDPLEAKDRNARGQRHRRTCSPKKSLQSFFSGDLKKRSSKIFLKILTIKKKILSSSRGQGNFRGLDLRGQGLQNVSSRTLPPLIMSKRMMSRL